MNNNNNCEDLILLTSSMEEQIKVNYILPNQESVSDPYYFNTEGFDQCFLFLKMLVNVLVIF